MHPQNDKTKLVKKIIAFTFYFIFVSGLSCLNVTAQELTFKQALKQMHVKNEALKASVFTVDKSKYLQKAAQGLYYPKIWLDGKYTHIDDEISVNLNDIRQIMGTLHGINPQILPFFEARVQNSQFSTANINFSWLIYSGGEILAANRAADAILLENQEQSLYIKSILTTELAKRYYGYLFSLEAASVYKNMLNGIEQHLHQTRKLEQNGMLAQSERIHAEAAHAEALRKHKKAARKIEIVQAGLKNTLSSDEIITPVSPLFLTKKILPLKAYLDKAKQENHLLKKMGAKKELATQAYKAEVSSHLPKVYLFGKYELYKKGLTLMDPEWTVGVGVKLSLFEGFSNTHKTMAAKKQKKAVECFEAKAMRDIATLVEKKYNELMMEIEQFEALETSMKFANENLRACQRSFKAGITTSLSVVDAQLALSKVKIERLNTVYEFDIALAELLEVCGLSEKYTDYQNNDDVEVQL